MLKSRFGSPELEAEYIVCQVVRGKIFPQEYIDIRMKFADIPNFDELPEINSILNELNKMIITPFGLLDDKEINKFSAGENPKLLMMVEILYDKCIELSPVMEKALLEKFKEIISELEINMTGQDFQGTGEAINIAAYRESELEYLRQLNLKILKLQANMEYLKKDYGTFKIKIKDPKFKVGLNKEYIMYINKIISHPEIVSTDSIICVCLGRVLDSIKNAIPNIGIKDILNPYKEDESKCILEVLTYPKDFYSKCENEEIISSGVGETFGKCYPAYYKKFMDMYLEDFDKMDYQKQINFRKCFGIPEDNSSLLQMSSQYIALSYT